MTSSITVKMADEVEEYEVLRWLLNNFSLSVTLALSLLVLVPVRKYLYSHIEYSLTIVVCLYVFSTSYSVGTPFGPIADHTEEWRGAHWFEVVGIFAWLGVFVRNVYLSSQNGPRALRHGEARGFGDEQENSRALDRATVRLGSRTSESTAAGNAPSQGGHRPWYSGDAESADLEENCGDYVLYDAEGNEGNSP